MERAAALSALKRRERRLHRARRFGFLLYGPLGHLAAFPLAGLALLLSLLGATLPPPAGAFWNGLRMALLVQLLVACLVNRVYYQREIAQARARERTSRG